MPARHKPSSKHASQEFEFDATLQTNLAGTDVALRTSAIKQAARELGFDLVGVAGCEPFDEEIEQYKNWLDRGLHADLAYLQRNVDKRRDIQKVLPGAKSVLVLAYNYYTAHQHQVDPNDNEGKISRYAWGDDYHEVIPPKLYALAELIASAHPGSNYRVYTDTGPLMDKQWARRAGIGWQGKHSNVISREIGSWFFIATLVTDVFFNRDSPVADHCGTCTACIDACPTDAIHEPYSVDTGKCISYWTIETKPEREFPLSIAKNLEGWMFGCDICQDVCPWNRFEQPTDETRFQPRQGESSLRLEAVENYDQASFSARFRKSPIKRTKLAGLKRNARMLQEWRPLLPDSGQK